MSTIAPFAEQLLTPINFTHGDVIRPPRGMVVHTAVGTYDGTIGWMRNPKAEVSSYFVVAQDGRIAQCVDLDNKAWTQAAGNAAWIGVENEGNADTPLTAAQIAANGKILAWLHTTFGVALQLAHDPNGVGLGYHAMGGAAWSPAGHTCPGPIIEAQLPLILVAAVDAVAPAPKPTPVPKPVTTHMGDGKLKTDISTPALDGSGNGEIEVPGIAWADIEAATVLIHDSADPLTTHKYAPQPTAVVVRHDTAARIVLRGGAPGGTYVVRVLHA